MGYGWRGRIGLVIPSTNTTMESEFWKLAPNGVSIHVNRMFLPAPTNARWEEALQEMEKHTNRAVKELCTADVDIIVFGCTAGSFHQGQESERELTRKIEEAAKLPVITTSRAVVDALRCVGAQRIVFTTPYDPDLTQKEKDFLEANGFTVLGMDYLNCVDNVKVGWMTPQVPYEQVKRVFVSGADAIFVSCTNVRSVEIIKTLESDFGRPVVTSTQASMWAALRKLGIGEKMSGHGTLLEKY